MLLFALPPHERLARAIARALHARFGRIERRVFSDGERYVRPVTPVRDERVVVIANTGPESDVLLDFLILLHALRSSGARSVMLVIPYLAYARQDRSDQPQAPVTINLLARLLEAAGATSAVLVDPHSPVAARSFRIPVRVVDPLPVLAHAIVQHQMLNKKHRVLNKTSVIVAPDAGARHRAQRLASLLGTRDVVVLRKGRPRPNVARVAALTSADRRRIASRPAILVDDMIDTAGTITAAAQRLREAGASHIAIIATHAVLSGPALARLRRARVDHIIVSDSLALPPRAHRLPLRVVSLTTALAAEIRTVHRK